jgi:hypothetical protein
MRRASSNMRTALMWRPANSLYSTLLDFLAPSNFTPQGARSLANSQLYVDQLQALGRKHNATVLDIFTTWQRVPDWQTKFINPDKLHLGRESMENHEWRNPVRSALVGRCAETTWRSQVCGLRRRRRRGGP